MDQMNKLFRSCVLLMCTALGMGGVVYYGFGLPHEAAIALATVVTVIVGCYASYVANTIAVTTAATLTFIAMIAAVGAVAFGGFLVAGVLPVGSFIVGAGVLATSAFVAIALALQKDYGMPFGRVLGCLCAGGAVIGLGLYYLPEPEVVFRIGVVGVALMWWRASRGFRTWYRKKGDA